MSAKNSKVCDTERICEECFAGDTDENFWPGTCHAVERYSKWTVIEFGKVEKIEQMKNEIWKRGPITCGSFADPGSRGELRSGDRIVGEHQNGWEEFKCRE